MDAKTLKQMVAREAIESVMRTDESDLVVGIGTGSTAECFIAELPRLRDRIQTTVSSSERSSELLRQLGFDVQISTMLTELTSMSMAPMRQPKKGF